MITNEINMNKKMSVGERDECW